MHCLMIKLILTPTREPSTISPISRVEGGEKLVQVGRGCVLEELDSNLDGYDLRAGKGLILKIQLCGVCSQETSRLRFGPSSEEQN